MNKMTTSTVSKLELVAVTQGELVQVVRANVQYSSQYSSAFHSGNDLDSVNVVSYTDRIRDIGTSVRHQLAVGTDSKIELVSIG